MSHISISDHPVRRPPLHDPQHITGLVARCWLLLILDLYFREQEHISWCLVIGLYVVSNTEYRSFTHYLLRGQLKDQRCTKLLFPFTCAESLASWSFLVCLFPNRPIRSFEQHDLSETRGRQHDLMRILTSIHKCALIPTCMVPTCSTRSKHTVVEV